MKQLTKSTLKELEGGENIYLPTAAQLAYPEKVLQFGTGVLLRGLPDQYIHEANRAGKFKGRVVVVKSTQTGSTDAFSEQDGLYTVCVKGITDGRLVNEIHINASISRVLSANEDWNEVLALAASDDLLVVTSNTTEVGIVFQEENIFDGTPASFPGKLLAVLYSRYTHFNGDYSKGLVIIPAELVEENGIKLSSVLNRLAQRNKLDATFIQWMNDANPICNTLVDRIVPGKLSTEDQQKTAVALGYTDDLMIMSEPFGLWAIESEDQRVINALGFCNITKGCMVVPSIEKFKQLKLRMLNATHTFCCGVSMLAGMEFVKDSMCDAALKDYIKRLTLGEIADTIVGENISAEDANVFGKAVLDRFSNPFLEHKWASISAQFTLKMKIRCLPLIMSTVEKKGQLPVNMLIGFSAYLVQMGMISSANPTTSLGDVLGDVDTWGSDLSMLPGVSEMMADMVSSIINNGMMTTLNKYS